MGDPRPPPLPMRGWHPSRWILPPAGETIQATCSCCRGSNTGTRPGGISGNRAVMTHRGMVRLFTLGPDNEPLCVRLYVHKIEDRWAAMLVGDDVPAPEPGTLTGLGFYGETAKEAEHKALDYLGMQAERNRETCYL